MPTLIKDGRVVANNEWTLIEQVADGPLATRTIVPAPYALSHAESLFDADREIGVWVDGDAEPDELTELLDRIALIAIRFSTVNDGRGLSIAVLLRTRFGFKGELRAIGDGSRGSTPLHAPLRLRFVRAARRPRPGHRARRNEAIYRLLPGIGRRSAPRISSYRSRRNDSLIRVAHYTCCHNRFQRVAFG